MHQLSVTSKKDLPAWKQGMMSLFGIGRVVFNYGYVPFVIYLGIKNRGDAPVSLLSIFLPVGQ